MPSEHLKRRTFAIISHPDAGKTTLTEQLLKASGHIRVAGMVRAKRSGRFTVSDWMDIERERGISVTSTAIRLTLHDRVINILDTPGHQDFSEDTLRTLLAADFSVMVLDCSKGVEPQTIKLFEVCALRGIPVISFINKIDLPSKDYFDLFDELQSVLGIEPSPMNLPNGTGLNFRGICALDDPELPRESLELRELTSKFDVQKFLAGKQTPVFWGSAIKGIGVSELFDFILSSDLYPKPQRVLLNGAEKVLDPGGDVFVGFVFKVQSNINKNFRSRTAFLKVLSGELERHDSYYNPRLKTFLRASRIYSLFGQRMETVDKSFAGDVVGLNLTDDIKLGDILVGDKIDFAFPGFPTFAPQVIASITPQSTADRKSFDKGMQFFTDEGLLMELEDVETRSKLYGAVGKLQLDVCQRRLKDEFNVSATVEITSFTSSLFVDTVDWSKLKLPAGAKVFRSRLGLLVAFLDLWQERFFRANNQCKSESILLT